MRAFALLFTFLVCPVAVAQPADPPKYHAAIKELSDFIAEEVEAKRLPALSIALVDDQQVIWAKGYGFQDRDRKTPASENTVYRVGSVSKLFTDVSVMQLVEEGKLDLDAPLSNYVADFKPVGKPEYKPITLRMLMSHRSGLIREPPVGNYFDPTEPGVEKTIASLNGIDIVYPPTTRTKYSNGAIALVGYTLQKTQKEPFEKFVQRRVLDPLGMKSSSFALTPPIKQNLADAVMWTYHGREYPAPTFELGEGPAGCMYSTVTDLAKFQSCLFAGGKVGDKQLIKQSTIDEMFRVQFAAPEQKTGFGLGFIVNELDGTKRVSHGGAIYGFATEWAILPEHKLGVIVVASRDVSNAVTTRIGNDALRLMMATKTGKPLPTLVRTLPIGQEEVRTLAGRYSAGEHWIELEESAGRLYFTSSRGFARMRVARIGQELMIDDAHAWGARIGLGEDSITFNKEVYSREKRAAAPPPEPPARFKGLIGEYGWDHNTLYIYERAGKLCALIEWTEIDVLTEESENVFAFPANGGMYHGEKLIFTRDASGRATKVEAAKVVFERRKIDGENGETFKIKPERPLIELRKEALAAKPPVEAGDFLKPDLVDLAAIDPTITFDIRYATENNFLSTKFYTSSRAFMQKPAAEALGRANKKLAPLGYGIHVFDAYRPWHVSKMFWDATPVKFHNFVADPSKGSRHNRGCAVDLTLYDLKTGKPVEMVSGFDEFSDRSYPDYTGGTSHQRWHRDLLRRTMESEGFTVYEEEWWHFDFKDWKRYPILNKTFEELK